MACFRPLQFRNDPVQLIEACVPKLPVTFDPRRLRLEPAWAELAGPHSPGFCRGDEPCLLQDTDVLLHAGEGHVERPGKFCDRSVRPPEPLQNATSGGVGERGEGGVQGDWLILNHTVQYIVRADGAQEGDGAGAARRGTTAFMNRVIVIVLVSVPGSVVLSAQPRADTLALANSIADVIAQEAAQRGDHHGPFVLMDTCLTVWARTITAGLQTSHKDLLARPGPNGLQLRIGTVIVQGDSARATLRWSRCTHGESILNWWEHTMTYVFVRSGDTWRFSSDRIVAISDGRC